MLLQIFYLKSAQLTFKPQSVVANQLFMKPIHKVVYQDPNVGAISVSIDTLLDDMN